MLTLGVNAVNHDASLALVDGATVLFAAHAERYSGKKFDSWLNDAIVSEVLRYGRPEQIVFFEHPWLKKTRQLYTRQIRQVFDGATLPGNYLKRWFKDTPVSCVTHHYSHACAGFYTSPFDEAVVLIVDAIGEWETVTIWHASAGRILKRASYRYPFSIGLFYSAITGMVGLRRFEDEYILMGMAGLGQRNRAVYTEMKEFFFGSTFGSARRGLFHGANGWRPQSLSTDSPRYTFDLAANAQWLLEDQLTTLLGVLKETVPESSNLVYGGGVALNCVANSDVVRKLYSRLWIFPNPGDAGCSLGAALSVARRHAEHWTPYLGTQISGDYPALSAARLLAAGEVIGIANGRAEFGPRALGNRSLLADPRSPIMKERVNKIKQREEFRPFAAVIREEDVKNYFDLAAATSPYMQFTARCLAPKLFPAICHVDGTSRIQTVSKQQHPGLYALLGVFNEMTGCPMLLNTSLNIKGRAMVNDEADAAEFQKTYGIPVLTRDLLMDKAVERRMQEISQKVAQSM